MNPDGGVGKRLGVAMVGVVVGMILAILVLAGVAAIVIPLTMAG